MLRSTHARAAVSVAVMCLAARAMAAPGDQDAVDFHVAAALRNADELRMKGEYAKALDAYAAFRKDPRAAIPAACAAAQCHLQTGDDAEAERALTAVADAGENSNRWHRAWADLLSARGDYSKAILHARRALDLNPTDHQARYQLGRLYERVGERQHAIDTYRPFDDLLIAGLPDDPAELTAAAGGFLRFSDLTGHPQRSDRTRFTLHELYQRAYQRIDRDYWPARLAAADLLRSRSRNHDAAEDYLAALKINPRLADAHVGLGWIALDAWDFEAADEHVREALCRNARSVGAMNLRAAVRLTERRYEDARSAAESALRVNPNDLAALAYAAAASYALHQPDATEAFTRRARAVNPAPAEFHRVLADTLAALRQYADAETQYRRAIDADPTDPHPRTELGMMYMQWGDETQAAAALAAAWELDDFDARTLNTLNLLHDLDAFARHETDHFIVKYDPAADAVLPPYIAEYLEQIHQELAEDFNCTLTEKTTIELFPTHRMFGVRITGKPWIHTVGACTGRVIALESPRVHPELQGPYHITRVLRHEYTHTVTLAATGNRIPHWFTEGLAVMQEDAPRPWSWRRLLADAIRRDELFTLQTIDWGFIRPQRPTDRQKAYAQSEWMCRFIVERFGYDAVLRMLERYRERASQATVMQDVLGLGVETFDAEFSRWAASDAAGWGLDLNPPEDPDPLARLAVDDDDNADLHARLARAQYDAGQFDRALLSARRAIHLDERHVLALDVLGRVLWALRDGHDDDLTRARIDGELVPAMRRLQTIDDTRTIAPRVLGAVALERKDYDQAVAHFTKLKKLLPLDPSSDRSLAGVYLAREQSDEALPHLLALAQADMDDAQVSFTLADIYDRRGQLGDARYWYTQSIYADAFAPRTHLRLADVCERMSDVRSAAREYQALCILQPDRVAHFEQAASTLARIGDLEAARRFARQAVALNPNSAAASLLRGTDDGRP